MKTNTRIIRSLRLHKEIMTALESKLNMETRAASREALRRLQVAKFKFDDWQDYFTAVELHGADLTHE